MSFTQRPEPWMDDSACSRVDPALWFPEAGGRWTVRRAVAICDACPVRDECLAYALAAEAVTDGEPEGIWGGKTAGERSVLLRVGAA